MIRGSLDVFGIVCLAIVRSTSVKDSMGLLLSIISSQTNSVEQRSAKVSQSALSSFHLWVSGTGVGLILFMIIGK
jgi:hypothetical protein